MRSMPRFGGMPIDLPSGLKPFVPSPNPQMIEGSFDLDAGTATFAFADGTKATVPIGPDGVARLSRDGYETTLQITPKP